MFSLRETFPMRGAAEARIYSRDIGRPRAAPAPRRASLPPVVVVLGLMAALAALLGLRQAIVRNVPQMAGLYAAIGAPVNLVGLDLREVRSRLVVEGERKVLSVEGEIVNLRRDATPAPPLLVTVRGEDGRDRYAWTVRPQKSQLAPGEKIPFRARLVSPPADGADVLVRFALR